MKRKSIEEWEERIEQALDQNGPFSHNIISLALGAVADEHGNKEANKLIDKYNLEDMGWNKESENE